ncbi:MAG: carboxypeptidase regulatory-like domain-containing protein [Deltaproteobacteria bacterium]|nr:carboxypeptidase regulatory-like domain-containing protein [Deltaproteobacteria bacterium]
MALAAGLVLVVVIVAMIVGLHCGGEGRDERPQSEGSWSDDREDLGLPEESPSEQLTSSEELGADDDDEPAAGFRQLHGIVTDGDNHALPGVEIEVEGFGRLRTVSDGDGAYSLHSVPSQAATLVARATGFAETLVEVGRGEPEGDQTVDVSLDDGDGVAGQVLDPDGKAVSRAQVGCIADFEAQRSATTDPYGRFELPAGSAGCKGVAKAQGFDDAARVVLELGTGNLLVLSRLASIAGEVLDSSGRPPRSFTIAVDSFQPAAGGEAAHSYRHTFANPRGSFTVRGLRAGTYVFSLRLPRGEQLRTAPITVQRGEQRTGLRLRAE